MSDGLLEKIIQEIDMVNNSDPRKINLDDEEVGYELFYAILMTKWVTHFSSDPSISLLIACRGIHFKRWLHPRSSYPQGLAGYYQWKKELQVFHQDEILKLLAAYELDESVLQKISSLILKKELGQCDETQIIEDAVSLIFIEYQLLPLLEKSGEEKVINAIQKTWGKMSEAGHEKALALKLDEVSSQIIQKALA